MNSKDIFLNYLSENGENGEKCLISNEVLVPNAITLECNHKFNYMELYYEVVEQKTKKILDNSKLKLNEIKCPYCRSISKNLLPYFKYYNTKPLKGVDHPADLSIKLNECQYIEKNSELCGKNACITKFGIFCNNHVKYNIKEEEILSNTSTNVLNLYKKKTIKELKKELQEHAIKLSGKKEELINRLIIYYYNIQYQDL
jgi:hypothetical protein